MKKGIHPDYRPVVLRDPSANFAFLTRSTMTSAKTIDWEDGNTYPLVDVDVSSAGHPFCAGRSPSTGAPAAAGIPTSSTTASPRFVLATA